MPDNPKNFLPTPIIVDVPDVIVGDVVVSKVRERYNRVQTKIEEEIIEIFDAFVPLGIGFPSMMYPTDVIDEDIVYESYSDDGYATINIPGTPINYPIMLGEEYISKDTYGNYSYAGSIFVTTPYDFGGIGAKTIYGHNMKNGTMFGYVPTLEAGQEIYISCDGIEYEYRVVDKLKMTDKNRFDIRWQYNDALYLVTCQSESARVVVVAERVK